jgi:hypothetical protein
MIRHYNILSLILGKSLFNYDSLFVYALNQFDIIYLFMQISYYKKK